MRAVESKRSVIVTIVVRVSRPVAAPQSGSVFPLLPLVTRCGSGREYPDILLDVTTDDSRTDIVAGGFDAGIRRRAVRGGTK